ncbi:MAG: ATP-dependent 6-phosphofructokinase [Deltaproteobacteria bacterium HGW-Deltaproteobacteria-14]|jgi:6-phosphofructokinase 1|nr:MAG: ATP-dependent 6-phosphofructokinase [Deltaproteobacteria bacterium HGW-Deltaproteobacteria-14]
MTDLRPRAGAPIALLTSGGDAPGMNAAIRAATAVLAAAGHPTVGVQHGYHGLIRGDFVDLGPADVASILREGGTTLGSARSMEFMTVAGRDRARGHLRARGIAGLVVIGGNGSLAGATALTDPAEAGDDFRCTVTGVPASIDNDIGLTGMAIGVDTAMNTIVEACDKISDTASAHDRTFIVEVMGRDCGYLAMTAAIAAGADAVLFREAEKTPQQIVDTVVRTVIRARERAGRPKRVIIIKSEGTPLSNDQLKERVDAALREKLGPDTPPVETRVTVLGHVVRGGRPSAFDRLLASRLAHVAVKALLAGEHRKMAAWLLPGDIPSEIGIRSTDDPYCFVVDFAAVQEETRCLLDGTSKLVQWRRHIFEDVEDILPL